MTDAPLYVRVVDGEAEVFAGTFDGPFRIGRADHADVRLDSREVRPDHAEVTRVDGVWWLREVGRANQTFVGARTVSEVRVDRPTTVRLGWRGPEVTLSTTPPRPTPADDDAPAEPAEATTSSRELAWARQEAEDARRAAASAEARGRSRVRWGTAVGATAVVLALVVALGLGWADQIRQTRLEETLLDLHAQIRAQDVTVARLRALAASRVDPELDAQIAQATVLRQELSEQYDAGVRQTSLYTGGSGPGSFVGNPATTEEEAIYRVARALGESELDMPRGFVKAVQDEIHGYWMDRGRGRFVRGIERARAQGVDRLAVETFERYGLPRQLFYMALQESDFNPDAVGPRTRWGIAKGMWQFIPPTARRYGLATGPDAASRVPDPLDDRHDVGKATEAAAKYLSYIYTTDAQSSGLLVIASYNWGEGRVIKGVRRLGAPQAIPSDAFEGIPETPRARSYWHFLTVHRDRMPAETKDYVMKIFAAAVIGENPRLFGFDFGDPLAPYSTMAF
ncbi:transglycosylase SLT domain-containing protein [Rubrivirga sp.]|uniref:transglycosylase SLT domain-containing protein n=1 Tax=Rubrivirga sp. TaxID=1885344 RepID=UPI003B515DCF